jgi:hypothetical protein
MNNRERSPYHYNQFGGNIGGPVRRDKGFIFFDYDGQRNTQPNTVFLNLPRVVPSDPDTQRAIQTLTPLANSWTRTQNQDVFLIKTDWILSSAHNLSVRYNHQNFKGANFENGGAQHSVEHTGASNVNTNTLSGTFTSILSSRFFSELRAQFARDKEPGEANSANPEANIFEGGQTVLIIGRNFFSPRETTIKRGQISENVTYFVDAHTVKFGADVNVDRIFNYFPGNFSGSYRFNSLASFANGRPTGAGENYVQAFEGAGTTGPTTHPNITEFAAFIQDDWRVSNTMTLNLGLRYDLQSWAQPLVSNPDAQLQAAGIDTGRIQTDKNNFGPRLGFAFRPGQSGRSVIRGAYGWFFARTPAIMIGTAHSNNGLNVQTITVTGSDVPTYPNKLAAVPAGATVPRPTIFVFSKDYQNPLVQHGSFGLEYGLSDDLAVQATYLFARGSRLQRSTDMNVGVPVPTTISTNEGNVLTYRRYPNERRFSNFNRVISFESTANSVYHGLALTLNKRYSRNLMMMTSYTFGKVIDDVPDATAVVPNSFDDSKFAQDPQNFRDDRGPGINDQPHRFVMSGLWDLRYADAAQNAVVRALAGGWSVSGIFTAQSGQPYSGLLTVDLNNDGNNRNDRAPNLGRNTFRLPKTITLDPRVTKEVPVKEHARLQFIFEAFNVLNRSNFSSVRTTLYSLSNNQLVRQTNFGTPLGSGGPRIIQIAAKVLF